MKFKALSIYLTRKCNCDCFSLCELLSVTALLSNATGKFQDFINDVITTLWGWAQHSRGDVASAALKYEQSIKT